MAEKTYTEADMRAAFVAGEEFQKDVTDYDMQEVPEITKPDFGVWMNLNYNVEIK